GGFSAASNGRNWVGNLILEAEVEIKSVNEGELRFELSKGVDRFQVRFQLGSGECTLLRLTEGRPEQTLDTPRATSVKAAGTYRIRLANVDEGLTLWVNDQLTFGDGVRYPAASWPAPTKNDLEPASIGVKGAGVELRHLRLW